MKKTDPQNRRRAARLHHELPVAYRSAGSFLSDWATNISRGGLFINTQAPPVGTELRVVIQIPGRRAGVQHDRPSTRVARVGQRGLRRPRDGARVHGFGGAPERERLEALVERIRRDLDVV